MEEKDLRKYINDLWEYTHVLEWQLRKNGVSFDCLGLLEYENLIRVCNLEIHRKLSKGGE